MIELRPIANRDGLYYFFDGPCLCVVMDGFKNLQESPAVFPKCPICGSCKILPPAPMWHTFTCDDCGHDFILDLDSIHNTGEPDDETTE